MVGFGWGDTNNKGEENLDLCRKGEGVKIEMEFRLIKKGARWKIRVEKWRMGIPIANKMGCKMMSNKGTWKNRVTQK